LVPELGDLSGDESSSLDEKLISAAKTRPNGRIKTFFRNFRHGSRSKGINRFRDDMAKKYPQGADEKVAL